MLSPILFAPAPLGRPTATRQDTPLHATRKSDAERTFLRRQSLEIECWIKKKSRESKLLLAQGTVGLKSF